MDYFDRSKARERGMTCAIGVVAVLIALIFVAHIYLSRPLGEELSAGLSLLIGVFAIAVLFPVQNAYANWEARRFCSRNGHVLANKMAADGRPMYCATGATLLWLMSGQRMVRTLTHSY